MEQYISVISPTSIFVGISKAFSTGASFDVAPDVYGKKGFVLV